MTAAKETPFLDLLLKELSVASAEKRAAFVTLLTAATAERPWPPPPPPHIPDPPPVVGEVHFIEGEMYLVCEDRVYEYNALIEEMGAYVGRLHSDGETIDRTKPDWVLQVPVPSPEPPKPEEKQSLDGFQVIDGVLYYVLCGYVYAYDAMLEVIGQPVGRLLANGKINVGEYDGCM